jgi:hypothetical protein
MAKKRALVDAALSATRSSGLFTQDAEDLDHWIADDEDGETAAPGAQDGPTAAVRRQPESMPAELNKARYDARAALVKLQTALGSNQAGKDSAVAWFANEFKASKAGEPLGVDVAQLSARQCGEVVEACRRIAEGFNVPATPPPGTDDAGRTNDEAAPEVVDESDRPLP